MYKINILSLPFVLSQGKEAKCKLNFLSLSPLLTPCPYSGLSLEVFSILVKTNSLTNYRMEERRKVSEVGLAYG